MVRCTLSQVFRSIFQTSLLLIFGEIVEYIFAVGKFFAPAKSIYDNGAVETANAYGLRRVLAFKICAADTSAFSSHVNLRFWVFG